MLPPEAAEIQPEQNTKPLSGRVEQGQAQFARRRRSRDCTRSKSQKWGATKVKVVLAAIAFQSPTNETKTKWRGLRSMRPERVPENRGSVLSFVKPRPASCLEPRLTEIQSNICRWLEPFR